MRKQRRLRKGLAMFLSLAMVVELLTGMSTMKVSAEEISATSGVVFELLDGAPEGIWSEDGIWDEVLEDYVTVCVDERYYNLLDGDAGSKWCCEFTNPSYVIFKASQPIDVDGYSVWTAYDTASYPGRNPVAWTLSACNDYDENNSTGGNWKTIHEVTGDKSEDALPCTNVTEKRYSFEITTEKYQYFKLNITSIKNGSTMQLGDFALTYGTCEHDWVKTGDIIEPTCTEGGYDVYKCSLCQATKKEANDTPAKGHTWVSGDVVDPTCTEEGYTTQTCSVCNATQKIEIKSALGHDFSAQTISDNAKKSDATCTEKAKYYYSCNVCGEVEKNDEHVFEDGELAEHTDENLDGKCDVGGEDFKTFEQLGKLIIKVNQNLSDGKYANVQYTTASIDNLRKALVAANAITAESSDTDVAAAFDNLLAASTVGAGGLIKADKNIVIAFADTGAVRGIAAGNGWYAIGETVTLKVTPSVGYTFSKWTTDTAGDTSSVGTESTYTFTLAEDSLNTYYAWLDEVKYTVTCNTAEGGTCSTDAEGGKYVYGQTAKVTATADANYEFVGWKDSYGTTVSTDNIYSFTVIGNTTLTPEFVKVKTDEGQEITYVMVSFYHQSGKLLDSQKVVSGEGKITTTVNAPTKVGFDFSGWSTKVSGATLEDVIDFSTATFIEDTSFYPVFEAQNITYTLTVDLRTEQKSPQSSVTVTADPIEGKQFVGWKNAEGNIVSYDSTYTFIITGDTTLTSYYESINAEIEKTPTISMSAPVYEDINDNGSTYYKMIFYFDYTLPEDCTLIDIGTIKVKDTDLSSDGITLDTENVSQYSVLSKLGADGQFYYSKANYYGTGHTVAGYMIYEKNGIRYTVYSNALYGIKAN